MTHIERLLAAFFVAITLKTASRVGNVGSARNGVAAKADRRSRTGE